MILYQPEIISTDYDSMFSAPSHYKTSKVPVQENYNQEQGIEELEELDQIYEQLNKKCDEQLNKKCDEFVDETYDNLFIVSHNLSSKPEPETEYELKSDDIQRITSEDNFEDNFECNCNSSSDSDSD